MSYIFLTKTPRTIKDKVRLNQSMPGSYPDTEYEPESCFYSITQRLSTFQKWLNNIQEDIEIQRRDVQILKSKCDGLVEMQSLNNQKAKIDINKFLKKTEQMYDDQFYKQRVQNHEFEKEIRDLQNANMRMKEEILVTQTRLQLNQVEIGKEKLRRLKLRESMDASLRRQKNDKLIHKGFQIDNDKDK